MQNFSHINRLSETGSKPRNNQLLLQPDLEIGEPDNIYERQADAIADQVMMEPAGTEEDVLQMETMEEEEMVQMEPVEEEEVLQMESMEEEEMAQMEPVEEEEVLQMESMEEEEMLQMDPLEEEELLQTKPFLQANDSGAMAASPGLSAKISSSQGTGSPLDPSVQREMSNKIGSDFSNVNIHTGHDAAAMSSEIGARAFTVGNDIYFNQGQYAPHSSGGKHLLAHELAHTVQQGGVAGEKRIQKLGDDDQQTEITRSNEFSDEETGSINTISKEITIQDIPVPEFKSGFGPSSEFSIPPGGFPRSNNHIPEWESDAMQGEGFNSRFNEYAASQNAPDLLFNNERIFYLSLKQGSGDTGPGIIFGSLDTIRRRTSRPYWSIEGRYMPHDVDHKRELQLGGEETDTDNMWMLESSANRSSGSIIRNSRKNRIEAVLNRSRPHLVNPPAGYEEVRQNYTTIIENGVVADSGLNVAGNPDQNYELNEIKGGEHLSGLNFLTESEVEAAGLRGSPEELVLFTSQTGGLPIRIPWDEAARAENRKDNLDIFLGRRGGAAVIINVVRYNSLSGDDNSGGNGQILCTAFPGAGGLIKEKSNLAYEIEPVGGISYGGYITRSSIERATERALEFEKLSPIVLSEVELDPETGLAGRGIISPTIPLISNAEIELVINEDGVRLRKIFNKSDFDFPSPFEIKDTTLEVFAGTQGLGIEGRVDFGIEHVGEGHIGASASTSGGFELEGAFNFDSDLFDPAAISVEYKDETWTIGGEIGIPEGKIRGIRNASITATYSEGNFEATGEAELDIPGIERGTMNIQYSDEGFSIGGAFDLSSDIPGIRSGRVEATVSRQSGDEEYNVLVRGTAQPDIPGINSSLSIEYDNGALTIAGTVSYSRGMLSGEVTVGATNRTINEEGMPEGEPDDTMRVYGSGSLTLRLTPWLEATAGVTFLPNGEMEIQGRIGLPATVDVFPRREFRRNLFRAPTIEIPLFAIPVGPRSIGLVAQIGGGLDFSAGFGPGQLRELYAEITYNPDREEETELSGRGMFAIPADAGLTLSGDVGLGVSVAIASLTGGIELAGTLGLEGEASAAVDVNWTPQTGIELDAEGRVMVNPKFLFDVNAFARAKVGIGRLSRSKTWRHNLAGFEWGPDIRFGLVFPVHYKEGEAFSLSFDDIEVIYPELNIPRMARGLASDIKNDLF